MQAGEQRRRWVRLEDAKKDIQRIGEDPKDEVPDVMEPAHSGRRRILRVMSYNILAKRLAEEHYRELYSSIPWKYVDWSYRVRGLLREISSLDPDILCLQEVDSFEEIERALGRLGYKGDFIQRSGHPEGCATFWKGDIFTVTARNHIDFSDHDLKQNVALIHTLETKSRWKVVVGNVHVLFNPKRGDIKLAQLRVLFNKIDSVCREEEEDDECATEPDVIICGDFNCGPGSPVYQFVSERALVCLEHDRRYLGGRLRGNERQKQQPQEQEQQQVVPPTKPLASESSSQNRKQKSRRLGNPNKWSKENLRIALGGGVEPTSSSSTSTVTHKLPLLSAYDMVSGEPDYTSAHEKFFGTVDYIWYCFRSSESQSSDRQREEKETPQPQRKQAMQPVSILLPVKFEALSSCLPNRDWSSDHMSIVTDFLITLT